MSGVTMKLEMRRTQYIMKKIKMTKVDHCYNANSDRGAYIRKLRAHFLNVIKAKIASDGNGFLTADSDPFDIYAKMDLKALKKGFRLVRTHEWVGYIKIYLSHAKKLKKYETRLLLMKFFVKKSYEKRDLSPSKVLKRLKKDKLGADEDEIPSMSEKATIDAFNHYIELFRRNLVLEYKSKVEKLKVLHADMIKSQMKATEAFEKKLLGY